MHEDNQKIEVLMTAYKADQYIKQTLDSLPKNILITIGIDGCESTRKELDKMKLQYPHVRVLWCENNKGTYITRNTLMLKSIGDTLVFLDSDDRYSPDLIKTIENTDFDILQWSYTVFDKNEVVRNAPSSQKHANGTFAMRRHLISTIGGFNPWRSSADTFYLQRANRYGHKMVKTDKTLMQYRISCGSLTSTIPMSYRLERHREMMKLSEEIYVEPIVHDKTIWL